MAFAANVRFLVTFCLDSKGAEFTLAGPSSVVCWRSSGTTSSLERIYSHPLMCPTFEKVLNRYSSFSLSFYLERNFCVPLQCLKLV